MPSINTRKDFAISEQGLEIKQALLDMCADSRYNTESTFSADTETYGDNLIPFVDKHMNYLCNHKSLDPYHYLANLRLMTKVR